LLEEWVRGDPGLKTLARNDADATVRQGDCGAIIRATIERGDETAHVARTENLEGEFTPVVGRHGELDATADDHVRSEAGIAVMEEDVALGEGATDPQLREGASRRVILVVQEEDARQDFEEIVHDGAGRRRPGRNRG